MKSITYRLTYGTDAIIKAVMKDQEISTGSKAVDYILNKFEAMKKNDDRQSADIESLLRENQELKTVIKHLRYLDEVETV